MSGRREDAPEDVPAADVLREQTLNRLAIAQALLDTRRQRIARDAGMPFWHFTVLNHFSKAPERARTVTSMAHAFQVGQPTVTKAVQKLLAQEWLRSEPDPHDSRSRLLWLTDAGAEAHARVLRALAPDAARVFEGWDEGSLRTLHALVTRLKDWLDADRDGDAPERAGEAAVRRPVRDSGVG